MGRHYCLFNQIFLFLVLGFVVIVHSNINNCTFFHTDESSYHVRRNSTVVVTFHITQNCSQDKSVQQYVEYVTVSLTRNSTICQFIQSRGNWSSSFSSGICNMSIQGKPTFTVQRRVLEKEEWILQAGFKTESGIKQKVAIVIYDDVDSTTSIETIRGLPESSPIVTSSSYVSDSSKYYNVVIVCVVAAVLAVCVAVGVAILFIRAKIIARKRNTGRHSFPRADNGHLYTETMRTHSDAISASNFGNDDSNSCTMSMRTFHASGDLDTRDNIHNKMGASSFAVIKPRPPLAGVSQVAEGGDGYTEIDDPSSPVCVTQPCVHPKKSAPEYVEPWIKMATGKKPKSYDHLNPVDVYDHLSTWKKTNGT